ncbi:MAG: helix-turn-helix transcriptional regulator [Filimonas sp.]|nr:helix-turn-helix transcriptional regulator [Filimonas sp.]
MDKTQTLEEFYKKKFNWVPDTIRKEVGHFNVFKLDDFVGRNARPIPYSRKDYYKISLIVGRNTVHYADKTVNISRQALLFANPQIPYNWEQQDEEQSGYFCVFSRTFFHNFGNLENYAVFQPNGIPVYELTNGQRTDITKIFERMFAEMNSDYIHKYDVLRNLVFEILHSVLKMQPAAQEQQHAASASQRIASLFFELLERQFPIEDTRQRFALRSASDFATLLSVHVNHLNRALKEITEKTTSEIIAERLLQEAKILLKHTGWSVSEIAYALGFTEVTHFNNFFRKNLETTPTRFRAV